MADVDFQEFLLAGPDLGQLEMRRDAAGARIVDLPSDGATDGNEERRPCVPDGSAAAHPGPKGLGPRREPSRLGWGTVGPG